MKKPSRSARRKAAKRRLRRMGLLPQGGRQQEPQGGAAVRAAEGAEGASRPAVNVQVGLRKQLGAGGKQRGTPAGGAPLSADTVPASAQVPRAAAAGQRATLPSNQVDTVPPKLQTQSRAMHCRQGSQHPSQMQQVWAQAPAPPVAGSTTPALAVTAAGSAEPMSEAAFGQLPLLDRAPHVGDVLAYRLLEIGADLQPSVSEVRFGRWVAVALKPHCNATDAPRRVGAGQPVSECCISPSCTAMACRVIGADTATKAILLQPHPDAAVHPLTYRRAKALALRQAEAEAIDLGSEEEEEEGRYWLA